MAALFPDPYDLDVVQGATFKFRVTWTDEQATPQPISLAAYRAHMQIRTKTGGAGQILAELSSIGSAPDLTKEPSGATGVIVARIPATVTATLKKTCFYDLFVINVNDPTDAVRLVYGTVFISLSVTMEDA